MKPFYFSLLIFILFSCNLNKENKSTPLFKKEIDEGVIYSEEKHFENMRQLTFEGDNAEAYWSFDDSKLVFQAKNNNWYANCDQIFITDTNNYLMREKIPKRLSTGFGRTTCSYFLPGDTTILYASTHS